LAAAGSDGEDSVFCLPLAVDTDAFTPAPDNERRQVSEGRIHPILLFTGTMSFGPNIATAVRLVSGVLPLLTQNPEVRLVGRDPAQTVSGLARDRVIVTGEVHDIAAEYRAADIFVAPMPPSAGMKNKILEAMACGLPVVASPDAAIGFGVVPPGVLIGDTDAKIAEHIGNLLENRSLRYELGAAAREFVLRHHRWVSRTQRLVGLLSAPRGRGDASGFAGANSVAGR
jgi:glycosyltransferase involved in cell wall biosynthesis